LKKVLIHQPEYIPWVNFFLRLKNCDIFVILDDVQFSRRSFQNRNVIINNNHRLLKIDTLDNKPIDIKVEADTKEKVLKNKIDKNV